MAGKNNYKKTVLAGIFCIFFVAMTFTALCGAATVESGDKPDLSTSIMGDWLDVYGTLNMFTGAYVEWGIYAYPGVNAGEAGAAVNVYGCDPGNLLWVFEPDGIVWLGLPPVVTVYGPKFRIGSAVYSPPVDMPIPDGLLEVLSETDEVMFSLTIYSDIDVYLRALPESGPEEIAIDIKPGSYPNSINLDSKGVVPVAILGDTDFDVADVAADSVKFAGASPVRWSLEDVDNDGDMDLIFHFKTQELSELDESSTEATLTGQTNDAGEIQGSDTVKIVPSKKK